MDNFEPLKIRHFLITEVAGKKFAFDINDIDSIHTSHRSGVFDGMEEPVFMDWAHVGETGNEIIARAIYNQMKPELERLKKGQEDKR